MPWRRSGIDVGLETRYRTMDMTKTISTRSRGAHSDGNTSSAAGHAKLSKGGRSGSTSASVRHTFIEKAFKLKQAEGSKEYVSNESQQAAARERSNMESRLESGLNPEAQAFCEIHARRHSAFDEKLERRTALN